MAKNTLKLDHILETGDKGQMPIYQPVLPEDISKETKEREYYNISPALKKAVQIAILLGKPLLITGEPGTGKTKLAYYIARHYLATDESLEDRFFRFNTKTTSVASDLFYQYDSLRHFQYIQNHEEELTSQDIETKFIKYQALGKAIKSNKRCVVLIDEIDKAPRDLPNDILDVMEELSFEVPEIDAIDSKRIKTSVGNRPIVILTSNSEKNLPEPFLRRCVFHHIAFPNSETLKTIIENNNFKTTGEDLYAVMEHFYDIRKTISGKKPTTAEFMQWLAVLENLDFDMEVFDELNEIDEANKTTLLSSYSVLLKDRNSIDEVKKELL